MGSATEHSVAEFNHILFSSEIVTIGRFHAPVAHPRFHRSGVIEQPIMAFPRTSVAIEHLGGASFQANEKLITFYNKYQDYRREAYDANGDICDWFEFSSDVLCAATARYSAVCSPSTERPFSFAHLPSQTENFVRQRLLINYLTRSRHHRQPIDPLKVEEVALSILTSSLSGGVEQRFQSNIKISQKQRNLAEQVQFVLSLGFAESDSLQQLADKVNSSVFHLCRVFKKVTGQSIHQYKNELRLRQALGRIAQGDDLNHIALDLGYSSHSHFSTAFSRYYNQSPKMIRKQLLY